MINISKLFLILLYITIIPSLAYAQEEDPVETKMEEGDYIGALIYIFTSNMGDYLFFGILFLSIMGAFVIRYQSIIPVFIFGLLIFGLFITVIPAPILGLILAIMAIAGGSLLYMLFVREKK